MLTLIKSIPLLFIALFSGIGHADVMLDMEPGWPRLVDNETKIKSKYRGNTTFFEAESKYYERNSKAGDFRERNPRGLDPYFKEAPGKSRKYLRRPAFYTWANIRNGKDGLEVLDGLFEVYGALSIDGEVHRGLALSVSLLDIKWDGYTIAFETETDQSGYLCELGYCSYGHEAIFFNLTSGIFDGLFDKNFNLAAQTIASLSDSVSPAVAAVPVPAAIWLFASAIAGMGFFKKSSPKRQAEIG